MVRQTTDETATITLAWTYSPDGMVLLGEEGSVTNLDCSGNAIYDFSTGLIFKNSRYFDPSTGIYTTMGGVVLYRARSTLNRRQRRSKRDNQFLRKYYIFILLLVLLLLAGCESDPSTPAPIPTPESLSTSTPCPPTLTPMPTAIPTSTSTPATSTSTIIPTPIELSSPTPLPTKVIFFGGSGGQQAIDDLGPEPENQTPVWHSIADESIRYPGSKNTHANIAMANIIEYQNANLYIYGYSAGADSALIFAEQYYQNKEQTNSYGEILGLAMLGPTMTDPTGVLSTGNHWVEIIDRLLMNGTRVYGLNDKGVSGDKLSEYESNSSINPSSFAYWYDVRSEQEHWTNEHLNPNWAATGTNNNPDFRDEVVTWLESS